MRIRRRGEKRIGYDEIKFSTMRLYCSILSSLPALMTLIFLPIYTLTPTVLFRAHFVLSAFYLLCMNYIVRYACMWKEVRYVIILLTCLHTLT